MTYYIMKATATVDGEYVGELIQCKDCVHFDGYYCRNKYWGNGHGNYTPPIKDGEGFCDWAERESLGKLIDHVINLSKKGGPQAV